MRGIALGVVLIAALTACGGGGNPSGPSNSIPNVVGTYSGNVTISFPEIAAQLSCPSSTSVTQSGSTVNIAPIVMRGECNNLSIPVGQVTIDATGALQGGSTTTITESCGTYNAVGSGGFFGRELRISINATSRTCFNFNFTATLTR